MNKLDNTSETGIAITFLVMNLSALLRQAFWLVFGLFHNNNLLSCFLPLIISKNYTLSKKDEQTLYGQGDRQFTHLSQCCFMTFSASPN